MTMTYAIHKAIRFSITSYHRVESNLAANLARNAFEVINPILLQDRLKEPYISWGVFSKKLKGAPWQKMDWQVVREVNLETLTISTGTDEVSPLYDFQYFSSRHENHSLPDHFDWLIDERIFDSHSLSKLQDIVVSIASTVFSATNGYTGYISFDKNPSHNLLASPYERLARAGAGLNKHPYDKTRARGYFWGNFLTQAHLERIGGLEALRQLPIYQIETLSNGYYVQLTDRMDQIPQTLLQAVSRLFAPILPERKETVPPLQPNPYQFLLNIPYEGPAVTGARHNTVSMPEFTITPSDLSNFLESMEAPSEARKWLANNPSVSPLAANRFAGREKAQQFVERLYDAGAVEVLVSMIYNEPWRVAEDGGPYATSLIVKMPQAKAARQKIFAIAEVEMRSEGFLDENETLEDQGEDEISLWWD